MEGKYIGAAPTAMSTLLSGSDGAAAAPLFVGLILAIGYVIKLIVDWVKGKPQQELAQRKADLEYTETIKADRARADSEAEAARLLLKTVRHERDQLKEYAWTLRGIIFRKNPELSHDDIPDFPCPKQ